MAHKEAEETMNEHMDRALIAALVEREVESTTTWSRFSAEAGVSRATMHRLKVGDPRVTQRTLRRIEHALSLPFDSLTQVGVHDWDGLSRQGLNGEVIEWLKNKTTQSGSSSATDASSTSKTRSRRGFERGTV